jgi:glyoxylase-like metal-dependent hydrolase (beta-lactamase superfamily II)
MCQVDRRGFLATGAALATTTLGAAALGPAAEAAGAPASPDGFVLRDVGPGVRFAEGDAIGKGYSNNGWIVLEDYVLVVDATYPSGATGLLGVIRATTDRPVRFAFDTHHHGDHMYGNDVYAAAGATPVAHSGVLDEVRRLETGHYGGAPGRWEGEAKERAELKDRRLEPPSLLFPNALYFDDGRRRVELLHFGIGHTKGDACAWLPKEGILFTGDAAVNGPFNFVGDGDVRAWIDTLDEMKKIAPRVVCPGHGPVGDVGIIEDQQAFFRALWDLVGKELATHPPENARSRVEPLRALVQANPRIARYASGKGYDPFAEQVAKVYEEITGRKLPLGPKVDRRGRENHARAHGIGPAEPARAHRHA